jgi:predicted TIM-barrel enzyme
MSRRTKMLKDGDGREYVEVPLPRDCIDAVIACGQMTGRPVQEMLNEMAEEYVEADVNVHLESIADGSASA